MGQIRCPWHRLLEEREAKEGCHRCSRKEGYQKLCPHEISSHRDSVTPAKRILRKEQNLADRMTEG